MQIMARASPLVTPHLLLIPQPLFQYSKLLDLNDGDE